MTRCISWPWTAGSGPPWLWPVVIDGTIVVALLTVLAAKRAAARAAYPWALAGLFSLASVAFNIARPDRPVAQLVFAMAGRPGAHHPPADAAGRLATATARPSRTRTRTAGRPRTAHPHTSGDQSVPTPASPDRSARVGARARVWAAYEAQLAAGQTPTGAALARSAGVSERYGQRLLAEFSADPTHTGQPNGDRPTTERRTQQDLE